MLTAMTRMTIMMIVTTRRRETGGYRGTAGEPPTINHIRHPLANAKGTKGQDTRARNQGKCTKGKKQGK